VKTSDFNPDEAKALVERMKARGLIKGPGETTAVIVEGQAATCGAVQVAFVTVTPTLAAQWLRNNKLNRAMRKPTVEAYAGDMKTGEWMLTHQGIAFNDQDELIDGQHRLQAVVNAGVDVVMLVVTKLPTKPPGKKLSTMDAVDCGASRSLSDRLQLSHGLVDSRIISSTCIMLAIVQCRFSSGKATMAQVLAVLEVYGEAIKFAVKHRSKLPGLRTQFVLGAMALAYATQPKKAERFYELLLTGENLHGRSPVLHLRNWLLEGDAIKKMGSKKMRLYAVEVVAHHFKLFCDGVETTKFTHTKDGLAWLLEQQQAQAEQLKPFFS